MKKSQIENKKLILVTHYTPTPQLLPVLDRYSFIYYSNLDHLLSKDQVHTWMFGHIHINNDIITENGTRIVGNQKGRDRDNITDFSKNFIIKFD